jgi:hypothetical protein
MGERLKTSAGGSEQRSELLEGCCVALEKLSNVELLEAKSAEVAAFHGKNAAT